MNGFEMTDRAVECVRKVTSFVPEIAIVLGSGLGGLADAMEVEVALTADDIEGYAKSTVSGHKGRLLFGTFAGKKAVVQQGRIHYYEGYEPERVVLPVRMMCALGAKTLILTNAAGGVNETYRSGDFMAIRGQIAQFVPSPLRGPNDERYGTRFPDMSEIYSPRLIALARESAAEAGATLREGVYLQASGPNYETPEEIRAFRILGADAVGMSTGMEAIAAKHMGAEILGISLITNPAAGVSAERLSHEQVKEAAGIASDRFLRLVEGVVKRL
ncbi:MAG: purine-nucleoside phosphorylase [Clostridia bacterium]|nr:purine-nucleoside phosphorylase [Clostridia bacterium]